MTKKSRIGILLGTAALLLIGGGIGIWQWQSSRGFQLPRGWQALDAETIEYRDQSFDVVKVDPEVFEVRLFWKNEQGEPYESFGALKEEVEAEGRHLRFATNAGIFSVDHTPGGLHVENGNKFKDLNLRDGAGNFHMKPNGVFVLGAQGAGVMESETFQQENLVPELATQSGPMLVINDELHPSFNDGSTNKFIRNGVGVDQKGNIWFAISNSRVNFYDFASLFRNRLQCPDALYLDGSISEFYLPELDRNELSGNFCGILAVLE